MASSAPAPTPTSAAHSHSLANPAHAVRPWLDLDGSVHWSCEGSGDPDQPPDCHFEAPAPSRPEEP